jgi:SPP1 family predicted phage head-tail adaptor
MQAGKLDRRVQFQRASTVDDGLQSRVGPFSDYGSARWAQKTEVSGNERWRAGMVTAVGTTIFRVRHDSFTAGITPKDRLTCEGRTYHITFIKELGRREGLEISAVAQVDL